MRVTIVPSDGTVVVDGVGFTVKCDDLPVNVHAIQWDGVRGQIEYGVQRCEHCGGRSKAPNEEFTDFAPYQKYVDAWGIAKAAADQAAALFQEGASHDAGP